MASYVERIIDFLDRQVLNEDYPKNVLEDIEWAIEVISANRLSQGNLGGIKLDDQRPEIRAWTDMIKMTRIPLNVEEQKRLKEFEELHQAESNKKGSKRPAEKPQ